jgi:hypothetical protein
VRSMDGITVRSRNWGADIGAFLKSAVGRRDPVLHESDVHVEERGGREDGWRVFAEGWECDHCAEV